MAIKVFYAWQSDQPNMLCRGLIRRALDKAAIEINSDLEVEDALRPLEIDQDTQDIPGSPPIAETILEKIRSCDIFVPDLTFMPNSEGTRPTPNPNVLIEYGYALRALGDQRIVGVFNEEFGSVDDLPFDIQHKKWPIRYSVSDIDDSDESRARRKQARLELIAAFRAAFKTVLRNHADMKTLSQQPTGLPDSRRSLLESESRLTSPAEGTFGMSINSSRTRVSDQFPWDGRLVGFDDNRTGNEIRLLEGPSIFLQLKPRQFGTQLTNVETMKIVKEDLLPLAARRATGWRSIRNMHGGAVFTTGNEDPITALTASLLVRNGEIHGIDQYHLQIHKTRPEYEVPYIPTTAVEEILMDGLADYLKMARNNLKLVPPLDAVAGLEGIEGYTLAVAPTQFDGKKFDGRIYYDTVADTIKIDRYDHDPYDLLKPLFEKIYDNAGIERPDMRTVGKSQR